MLVLPVVVLGGIPMMLLLSTMAGDGGVETALGWTLALVAEMLVATALTAVFSLGFVVYLQLGDTEESFGGGLIAVVVVLGRWLFVANTLLLAAYETVLELEDEGHHG